jgi:hypothetical protein
VRDMASVLAVCPNDESVWQMVAFAEGQLDRSALLHLELVPNAASWMVAVNLSIEPIGGAEVTVASDVIVSRDSVPGLAEQHDLRLPPVSVHVPAGATVRLRLSNHWLHEFPRQPKLAVAPLFSDFAVNIKQGAGPSSSWLELPLRPMTPKLVVKKRAIDLATLPKVDATVRGGLDHAGDPYFVSGSAASCHRRATLASLCRSRATGWLLLLPPARCPTTRASLAFSTPAVRRVARSTTQPPRRYRKCSTAAV